MSFDSEKASTKFFVVEVKGRLHLPVVATCFDGKENETLLVTSTQHRRPCGLMDKAPDFGSGDCRFESCHGRLFLVSQDALDVMYVSEDKTTVVVQNFFQNGSPTYQLSRVRSTEASKTMFCHRMLYASRDNM